MKNTILVRSIMIGLVLGTSLYGISKPHIINADFEEQIFEEQYEVSTTMTMVVTAYTGIPELTDDSPETTASNKKVEYGMVATNILRFGTKVRIPELFGDQIFVVEDRMHQRKGKYHLDIWFPEYSQAKNFGAQITYIEVIES